MFQDKIVFLGDSIFRRTQNTASFKALFDKQCVVNLAVSGSTIAGGLETLFRYISSVDVFWGSSNLVILLGTNDFLKNSKFDYPNYDRLINTAAPLFKQVILVDIPPIPKKPLLAEKIRIANLWIASQACRGFQVIQSPRSVGKDLVHLNERGMQALGLSVWESLFEKVRTHLRIISIVDTILNSNLNKHQGPLHHFLHLNDKDVYINRFSLFNCFPGVWQDAHVLPTIPSILPKQLANQLANQLAASCSTPTTATTANHSSTGRTQPPSRREGKKIS